MRLRYWAQEALKFTGIIMAAALFYTFLMMVQDTRETWNEYLEMGALYLGMFGACMCMILGTSIYQVHAPLAISLGSTRKEVLLGIQCYRFVIACILLAVAALLLMLTGETAESLVWTILLHSAATNDRWCGDQRPLCGVSGQDISKAFRRQW